MVSIIVLLLWNSGLGEVVGVYDCECLCVWERFSVRMTRFDHFHWCWGSLTERLVVLWGFWVSDDLQNPAAGILPLPHRNHAANIIKKSVYTHKFYIMCKHILHKFSIFSQFKWVFILTLSQKYIKLLDIIYKLCLYTVYCNMQTHIHTETYTQINRY